MVLRDSYIVGETREHILYIYIVGLRSTNHKNVDES